MITSEDIKKHISYTSAQEVAAVCKPLFDEFNINFFSYIRLYLDGSALVLVSNADWHHCVFKNKHVTTGPMLAQSGFQLWENYSSEKVIDDLNHFNLNNGMMIYNKNNVNYVEFFELASSIKERFVIEFYLNNLTLLQQFLLYFKEKADKLIKLSEKNKLLIPEEMLFHTMENPTYKEFMRTIKAKKIKFEINSQNVTFSKREYECLTCIAKGRTVKEAANILNLSPKTIETHLYNARNKTNCYTKSNLVDLFWDKLYQYMTTTM